MSGGGRLEVFNQRERAISDDHNRLQSFAQYDRAEILRRLVDCRGDGIFAGGGGVIEFGAFVDTAAQDVASIGTPLRGDVFEGLVVLPQSGSMNLLVSPGVIGVDDPDGQAGSSDPNPPSSDDSRFKIVVDPGIPAIGTLFLAAGSGSARIDVVECRRTTVVVEATARDVFDPSTGLFSAVVEPKVIEGRLVYRVRQGTPGAGLPASVQGWLPLCVVSVPSAATVVDDCAFWDVRPLLKDRIEPMTDVQSVMQPIEREAFLTSNDFTDPAETVLDGVVTSRAGMYRAGGAIHLDVADPDNWATGAAFAGVGDPWYLWAIFPGGLPRWVNYSKTAPLVPSGTRGVICASELGTATDLGFGLITPPPSTGLGGGPQPAVRLAAGVCVDLGTGVRPGGITLSRSETEFSRGSFVPAPPPASSTTTADRYVLAPDTFFPKGATAIRVRFSTRLDGTPGDVITYKNGKINVYAGPSFAGGQLVASLAGEDTTTIIDAGSGQRIVGFEARVPIPIGGAANGFPSGDLCLEVEWTPTSASGSGVTRAEPSAMIVGWRI